jgi:hypothetical protein
MAGAVPVLAEKIFSLTLILNSLVTLACVAQVMFYYLRAFPYWQPYAPYLVNGSVLFLVITAAVVNIFPCASIGRSLHTGRLWFHHYVYGLLTLFCTFAAIATFSSVSLDFFLAYNSSLAVNAGRFFVLAGFTLFLDDLPDVSKTVESALNRLKLKVYRQRRILHWLQLLAGLATFYVSVAVALWTTMVYPALAFQASFVVETFLVTSLTSLVCVTRGAWLKMNT